MKPPFNPRSTPVHEFATSYQKLKNALAGCPENQGIVPVGGALEGLCPAIFSTGSMSVLAKNLFSNPAPIRPSKHRLVMTVVLDDGVPVYTVKSQ